MKSLVPKPILFFLVLLVSVVGLSAQEPPPLASSDDGAETQRPNLVRALGLDRDQIREIARMNRERKPQMEAAQTRLKEASKSLDAAIYGDVVDEGIVAARLKEFQNAQAEVARIRFRSELALRRILRPEQLTRFRQMRERVANARRERRIDGDQPARRRPVERIRQLPSRLRRNN